MQAINTQWKVGFRGFSIVDGACFPEKHKDHIATVLEHIPKCCESDYVHNSRVLCSCGEEFKISDQFLVGMNFVRTDKCHHCNGTGTVTITSIK